MGPKKQALKKKPVTTKAKQTASGRPAPRVRQSVPSDEEDDSIEVVEEDNAGSDYVEEVAEEVDEDERETSNSRKKPEPAAPPVRMVKIPAEFFAKVEEPGPTSTSTKYHCLLCGGDPKNPANQHNIRHDSRHNARRHVLRIHDRKKPGTLEAFDLACQKLDSRDGTANVNTLGRAVVKRRQLTLHDVGSERRWNQQQLDLHVLELLLVANMSLNQATGTAFAEAYLKGLGNKARDLAFPSRRKLSDLIVKKYEEKKEHLRNILKTREKVATTADAWSSSNAGFLGQTVHWFEDDLQRKSACLSLKRIKGRQHYVRIARELAAVNKEFGLEGRISRTTTDNGQNFCKSFRVYGEEAPLTEDVEGVAVAVPRATSKPGKKKRGGASAAKTSAPALMRGPSSRKAAHASKASLADIGDLLNSGAGAESENEQESDGEDHEDYAPDSGRDSDWEDEGNVRVRLEALPRGIQPLNVTGILDEEDSTMQNFSGFGGDYNLPPHFRCAAHTLNLVATNDAAKAVSRSDIYGSCFESVMTKLRALWTRQSKSSLASDKIKERMDRLFKLEVKTRWNSSYDALCQIDDLSPAKKDDLNKLMEDLNLNIGEFRAAEFAFIKEYVEVMRPLAHSLDCLQGEGIGDGDDPHMGMGYLVPIIGALKFHYDTKFEEMQADSTCLRFCGKLVECNRDGLAKRFSAALKDDELLIAAAVHPKFRLQSMLFLDVSERDRIARLVKQRVADFVRESGSAHPSGAVINDDVPEPLDVDGNMAVAEADAPNPPKKKKNSLNELLGPVMRKLRETQPSSQGVTIDANFLLNQQIDAFLNGASDDNIKAFMGLEPLKKLFIETNTGLPSSAPVERLFSVAGHIFLPSRSRLKDRLLEPIVFLRANLKLLGL